MNKLMVFPLAFMFILTIFSTVYQGETYTGSTENYSEIQDMELNGTSTGTVKIPEAGSHTYNIWGFAGAMVIIISAIGIGIIAGIKVLGSGLSDTSQSLIFNSILFLGLWACLSAISSMWFTSQTILSFMWLGITVVYVIGLGIHLDSGGGE